MYHIYISYYNSKLYANQIIGKFQQGMIIVKIIKLRTFIFLLYNLRLCKYSVNSTIRSTIYQLLFISFYNQCYKIFLKVLVIAVYIIKTLKLSSNKVRLTKFFFLE